MRERGHDARDHQHRIARRHRAQHIADDEHAHQQQQRELARHPARDYREQWRADRDAERIAADEQARGRDRHGQIARHFGQQAHDDEFGRTDGECANRERE
ncbi:hypothetical protein OKW28_006657 [Paraburkholderia sp. 40]